MTGTPYYRWEDMSADQQAKLASINFLIIGAQKSGTSWLSTIVSAHSGAFIPERKELHFFNNKENYAAGVEAYLEHFDDAWDHAAIGEATPDYLWNVPSETERSLHSDRFFWEDQPARVKALLPNAALIVCLRDPVSRAISAFHHQVLRGRIAPWERIRDSKYIDDWGFVSKSWYTDQLQVWLDAYPPEAVKVLIYEEDIRPDDNKLDTANEVFDFLGLDPLEDTGLLYEVHNAQQQPLTSYLRQVPGLRMPEFAKSGPRPLAERLIRGANRLAPAALQKRLALKVDEADWAALREALSDEKARLEDLLQRELPWKH